MPESQSILVARNDFLQALRPLKKWVRRTDPGQAIIALQEGALSISAVGITVAMDFEGAWTAGEIRVPATFVLGLAKYPPGGDPIGIELKGDKIRVGDVSIRCVFENSWKSVIELPLDPTLLQVLTLKFLYTADELERAGLSARLGKAETVVERCIAKALKPLHGFGITTDDLRELVYRRIKALVRASGHR